MAKRQEHVGTKHSLSPSHPTKLHSHPISSPPASPPPLLSLTFLPGLVRESFRQHLPLSLTNRLLSRHTVNQHSRTAHSRGPGHEVNLLISRPSACTRSKSVQTLGLTTPTPFLHITRKRPLSRQKRAWELRAVALCQNSAITGYRTSRAPSTRSELSHSSSTYEKSAHAYSISLSTSSGLLSGDKIRQTLTESSIDYPGRLAARSHQQLVTT